MWRAFFMGLGLSLCILGLECVVVEQAVLASSTDAWSESPYQTNYGFDNLTSSTLPQRHSIEPPEWAPWGLISVGTIIWLYASSVRPAKSG
jgi:hypothetical protein